MTTDEMTYSQIKNTVVQASVKSDTGELSVFLLHFRLRTRCIFQRERKTRFSFGDDMELLDHQFSIANSAALDILSSLNNISFNQDDGLNRNAMVDFQYASRLAVDKLNFLLLTLNQI